MAALHPATRNLRRLGQRGFARLAVDTLPAHVRETQYAVRGAIVIRANEIDAQLKAGKKFPFPETIPCNIGNPQAVGAKPLTFHRQVLAILTNPALLDAPNDFPEDVKARAREYLASFDKFGAYSHSKGIGHFREEIAKFIKRRDGAHLPDCDPECLFLTNGASDAVKYVLNLLIGGPNDAVLVPVPQYPSYSASIRMLNGHFLGYYLEEETGWSTSAKVIQDVIDNYRKEHPNGTVRGLCVINPGNPTGQIMSKEDMADVVDLCEKEGIALLADEVYQENQYTDKQWHSFRKVVLEKKSNVELFSFHSVSKGFYGECGIRGGYVDALNVDPGVVDEMYKIASTTLCSNTLGQATMASIVNPPVEGDPSFPLYRQERDGVLASLKRKADMTTKRLNQFPGVSCQVVEGAMYAFPKIQLPAKAIEAAKVKGQAPDFMYCWELLEATGVVVVPGSGFAQKDGTFHFRTTILPDEAKLPAVMDRMEAFHREFLAQYT